MTISDERFELKMRGLEDLGFADEAEQLRERDTAQREAIKRLEASLAHACVLLGEADYQARLWEDYQTENEMEVEDHWVTSQVRDRIYKFLDGFKVAELVRSTYSFPRLVSWSEEMSTCTLIFKEREYYFDLSDDCKDDDAQAEQQEAQEIGPLKGELAQVAEQVFREQFGLQEAQGAQAGEFQRESLARVGAERDEFWDVLDQQNARVIELQEQLAKAVGLLEKVTETTGWDLRDGPLISQVHDFLLPHREAALMKDKGGRHAQAEQQEAHGAQAEPANFGQELEAFEKWRHTQADSLRRCGYPDGADAFIRLGSVQWAGWQARAALATQPAVTAPDAAVVAMARRLLWIAYVWNDHNFDYAHLEARKEAKKHGINNLEEANAWLEAQPAVRGAEHE